MQEQVRPDSPSVNPDSHPSRDEGEAEAGGSGINLDVPDDDRCLGGADGNSIDGGGGGAREELTGVNSSEPAASYSSHLWRSLDRFAETEPGNCVKLLKEVEGSKGMVFICLNI